MKRSTRLTKREQSSSYHKDIFTRQKNVEKETIIIGIWSLVPCVPLPPPPPIAFSSHRNSLWKRPPLFLSRVKSLPPSCYHPLTAAAVAITNTCTRMYKVASTMWSVKFIFMAIYLFKAQLHFFFFLLSQRQNGGGRESALRWR